MLSQTLLLIVRAAGGALRGDALADLRGTLQGLRGHDAVKGGLDHQFWSRQGDPKSAKESQGKVGAWVEEDGGGLRIFWPRQVLDQADREARARAKDPEKEAPTRRAMAGLSPTDVAEYLGAAEAMLRELESAQVTEDKSEPYQGRPARCLTLKVEPRLSGRDRKYVKELHAKAKVWLGPDGVPLGAEREMSMKGRAFLVISFEQKEKEELRFTKVGDRLVTTYRHAVRSGSGGGESGQSSSTTTLALRN